MSEIEGRQLRKFWRKVTPSGTINGSNVNFTLPSTPVEGDAVDMYRNGLYLKNGVDFTISGINITMTTAPVLGQTLEASYVEKTGGT